MAPTMRQAHDSLLARPMKHKVTKKFNPAMLEYFFKNIRRPVIPLNNKRLHMLAEANRFKRTSKWEEADLPSTCVSRAVLEATCTARLDHLSRPFVRTLKAIRSEREHYGQSYLDMMTDRINMSLDTIYYHNVKSLMHIANQMKKGKKKSVVELKTFSSCGDYERLLRLATAKKVWPPKAGPKRKRKNLEDLDRLAPLATPWPRKCYKSPSQDTLLLESRRRLDGATKYTPTEDIIKLSKLPEWKQQPPWVPPGISRAALRYNMTDIMKKLAEPAARSKAVESDIRENAFEISPGALKYKATPRIIDLAKPKERK